MSTAYCASEGEDENQWDLFQEPDDFRPKTPPPTEVLQHLYDGTEVRLKLVGSHPLWGHHLWNAAPVMADYLRIPPTIHVKQGARITVMVDRDLEIF